MYVLHISIFVLLRKNCLQASIQLSKLEEPLFQKIYTRFICFDALVVLDICVSYKCSPSRSSRAMNAHAPRIVPVNTRARKKFKRVGVMEGLASHVLPAARLCTIHVLRCLRLIRSWK